MLFFWLNIFNNYRSFHLGLCLSFIISFCFLFLLQLPPSIIITTMSCTTNSIDDLQDLAANLFQFPEDQVRQPHREHALKKQRKNKKKVESTLVEQKQQQEQILQHQHVEKLPGTHSIYVKTFGCSHNISDSQFMVGQLADYGYKIVESADQADLVLINSCTVVNPSQDAFINMVCKAKKIKKPIVVAGCVPQGDQNIPELSQVSAVGVTQIDRIVEVVQETLKGHKVQLLSKKDLPSLDLPKIRKNKDIQIIAVNAGCLGACTYCKTVFARGKLISYKPEAIFNRVKTVANEGVKQIWLTSQDTGAYGRDLNTNISDLLIGMSEQLKNHTKIMMRIGMTNPPYMLDHLSSIAHFLNHPRVYSFIHIPIQAGHNNVLEKMNREYTVEQFRQVVDYFIQHVPGVTIATDIICGFAEETDEEFQASLKLIEQYKFRVVNINQFYLRPGTPAANLKQTPTKVVKSRSSKLTELFHSYDKHGYMVGRTERVWINEFQVHKGQKSLIGHTKNYTKVSIPFKQELLYKEVIMKITKSFDWHVEGQIIDEDPQDLEIYPTYVENMKNDVIVERQKVKLRKVTKMQKIKLKKEKLASSLEEKHQLKANVYGSQNKENAHKGKCGCDSGKGQGQCCGSSCGCKDKKIAEPLVIDQVKMNSSFSKVQLISSNENSNTILKQQPEQIKTQMIGNSRVSSMSLIAALICIFIGVSMIIIE